MAAIDPRIFHLIEQYLDRLHALGIEPSSVVLYGSHASGTAGPFSDIDLLVVSSDFGKLPRPERPWILARANRELRASIQPIDVTPEEMQQASRLSFLHEIASSGVEVLPMCARR